MEFPPFEAFMDSLDGPTISGILKDASRVDRIVSTEPLDFPENSDKYQDLFRSFQISLELLAVYHKWLEQHF